MSLPSTVEKIAPVVPRTKSAVELVQQLAATGWQGTAAQRLSSYLGQDAYSAIDRRWKPKHCRKLAELANALSATGSKVSALTEALDQPDIRSLRDSSELALAFSRQASSLYSPIGHAVNGLRVSGIILCAVHDCLEECQCLKDFVKPIGLPALQSTLNSMCTQLFTEYSGRM